MFQPTREQQRADMSKPETFLDASELVKLTGRKTKSKQADALKSMRIPFFVNALGAPVVCRSAIEGGRTSAAAPTGDTWAPSLR